MAGGRPGNRAALTGGLVSSTAVTVSFARQCQEDPRKGTANTLACGVLIAWCIMFGRVIAEVLVVNRALVVRVLIPFVVMGATAGIAAWVFFRRGASEAERAARAETVRLRNPFSLTEASKFAAFFAMVLLVVKLVQSRFPGKGLYMVAALAGMTDVDAITLSMAEYARSGDARVAVNAIVVAALTNTVVKCAIVAALGGAALRRAMLVATGTVLAVGLGTIGFL